MASSTDRDGNFNRSTGAGINRNVPTRRDVGIAPYAKTDLARKNVHLSVGRGHLTPPLLGL